MKQPPIKKKTQTTHVKSAVRLPPELHEEVSAEAERNGRSLNAEIIARLRANRLSEVMADLAELKQMVQQLINRK